VSSPDERGSDAPTEPCSLVDSNFCTAPANAQAGEDVSECFACGLPVCGACSLVVPYITYGPQRLGHDCIRQHFGHNDPRPDAHIAQLAASPAGEPYRHRPRG
jgi:hypothetical protein